MIVTHLFHHADHQALLEATELATIPPAFVDRAGLFSEAHVLRALLHGPLEEALATLAGTHAVMLAGCCVATNRAKLARAGRCSLVAGSTSWRG